LLAATLRAKLRAMELGGERRFSRRDLAKGAAKVGAAGAAVVFIAPHFEDIAYAAGSTGSPPPETTTTVKGHPHPPDHPSCQGDPRVFFNLPHSMHVWGTGWAPSSKITVTLVGVKVLGTITVKPNGTFDHTFTIPAGLHADQLYRLSFSGRSKNGHPWKCGVAIFIDQKCKGAVAGRPQAKSGSALGVDTRSLVLVGAGAVVAGKSLYSLRNRVAAAEGDRAAH
jgi:hypothetical protein